MCKGLCKGEDDNPMSGREIEETPAVRAGAPPRRYQPKQYMCVPPLQPPHLCGDGLSPPLLIHHKLLCSGVLLSPLPQQPENVQQGYLEGRKVGEGKAGEKR